MADIHLPDIGELANANPPSVRFYALTGACISLVAGVEHMMFDCYATASNLTSEEAAKSFFRYARFSHKRDITVAAVQIVITDDHPLKLKWDTLLDLIQELAGPDAARNVLGHNPIVDYLEFDESENSVDIYEEMIVTQSPFVVLAGLRKQRRETISTLLNYAQRLRSLILRLARFLYELREACGKSLPSDALVLEAIRRRHRTKKQPAPNSFSDSDGR